MVVKLDENGNLVFGEPASNPGHSHEGDDDSVTWTELSADTTSWKLTDGYYYLADDITHNGMVTIKSGADVHICLNGQTMTQSVLYVGDNASVTICDCKEDGEIIGGSTGALMLSGGSTVDFYSGTISSEATAAVNITLMTAEAQATFNMHGGTINSKKMGISNSGGIVNVYGGTILFDVYAGVFNGNDRSVATIAGGTIQPQEDAARGDNGVYVSKGTLYLTGNAKISGLKGDIKINNPNAVYASKGDAAYSGKSLSIYFSGGAAVTEPVILDVTDGNADLFELVWPLGKALVRDSNNNLVLGTKPVGHQNHGADGTGEIPAGKEWIAWNGTTQMDTAGYYYLDENVTLTSTIEVTADVHLCLNGKTLASTADYAVEVTEDHALTICDCGEGGSIERTHESGINGGAVLVRGDFTLYGGSLENHGSKGYGIFVTVPGGGSHVTIAGGSVSSDVNAIQVGSASDVTLRGGQVSGKTSGVVLANDGISFTMTDGSVTAEKERGITTNNYDITLSISGGTIRGGDAGIRLLTTSGGGTTISGGTITSKNGVGIDQKDLDLSGWGEAGNEATLTLTGAPKIDSLRLEVAGKVNGAGYAGAELDVSYESDNAQNGDIVIVGTTDLAKFNLTAPEGKILVTQGGNLVLGEETVEVPELVLSALPETVTYGDTFTLTATGGGEGALIWAATGAATVDQEGNVTITGAGDFTIKATKGGKEATATDTAAQKAVTITAKAQTIAYGASIATGTGQVTVTGLVSGDSLRDITLSASDTAITPSGAAIEKNGADVTDNYTISYVSGVLTVTGQPQEGFAVTGDPESVTYGDTFKLDTTGGSGTGAVTWSATGAATVDQEGNVTITGAGDFTIKATKAGDATYAEATATYQATAQKRALTITADNETIAFNAAAPSYTATVTGAVQADKEAIAGAYTLTCEYQQGDPVGDYTITVTGTLSGTLASNYTVTTHNGKLHVVKALAEVEDAPDAVRNLVYTGNAQKLVTPGTAKNGTMVYSLDNKNYSETVPTATNADTYTVWYKVVGNNGYSDTAAKSFNVTIQKAALTVIADNIWVYAGDTPAFTATITGYVNGEDWRVLKGELTFTCGYSQKYSKPGSRYTITPKGLTADNYDITFKTGTLTVKDPLSPRFNVYVLDSKHGTVEADCRYARKGDVVTLTIKPDWGYELETLTVTDSHGYELKLTYHSNGTYTFTMPRDNVTVKAIFTVRDMPFVDVPGDAWYAGGVRYVYAHGLMNGTGNWRFSPNRTTTRAMIATILYRMEGSPRVYGTSQFGDVEAGSWYEDAVIWATQNDIVEGYTSKTFGPNDPITREQMAAMLYRYADYCRCDMSAGRYVDLSKYSDMNEISDYAIPALRWAVGEEIIQGRTGKRLAPTDTATRAEVAVMLMRFCEDVIW